LRIFREDFMHKLKLYAAFLAAAFVVAAACAAPATAQDKEYTPHVGQEGKDVIWVPTPQALVEKMLDMAKLTPKDIHYDLGSGDGRTVITAAKRGAHAWGVEFNPDMAKLAERAAAKEGVSDRAKFINGDIFQTDFSKATVVTLYLLPALNLRLRPTLLKMKPGTRVVSHAFSMDDWQPDQTENVEGRTAYLWIVPAQVEGTWRWNTAPGQKETELTLRQQFQNVEGLARLADGRMGQVRNLRLQGDQLSFSIIEITSYNGSTRRDYTGRVSGDTIQGTFKISDGNEVKWNAHRVQ
jgi:hypothetical protein